MGREKEALTTQVKCLGINTALWIKSTALIDFEIKEDKTLLIWSIKFHHFNRPVFICSLTITLMQSLLQCKLALPMWWFCTKKESLQNQFGCQLMLKVCTVEDFPEFST
jgi:hypothetical protein